MKRGKVEEKIVGPMFPRLHVNDTEKGGPRAPPRNKMALYEQLSIPSQRFNHGLLPLNPNNNSNLDPPASSSQGSGHERSSYLQLHSATPTQHAGKLHSQHSNAVSMNTPLASVDQRKKQGEDDDFAVPIFVPSHSKKHSNINIEQHSLASPIPTYHALSLNSNLDLNAVSPTSKLSARDKADENLRQDNGYSNQEYRVQDLPADELENASENHPEIGDIDRSDEVSETSMVDSISALDISPDDVVGIIGQKHFLKARRAITNQQRVFAVQVFELHRLVKVQRSIAGSPNILLDEDNAYLDKSPLKSCPAKKLPADFIIKPPRLQHAVHKPKDDSLKPNLQKECSAENAVAKPPPSLRNGPANYGPYSLPQPLPPDPKMGLWSYQPPPSGPGHQWLVPIMSPSEGLIYKPYPGPAFMGGQVYGGFEPPPLQNPMLGGFMSPPVYGVPAANHYHQHYHHHHQGGIGVPLMGQSYFPPYDMKFMDPALSGSGIEQMNGTAVNGQRGQNSCNMPKKSGSTSISEVHGSTASSTTERGQVVNEGNDGLPLFPTAHVPQPHDMTQPSSRVIRVVPHNPRTATETAARIFQSIQEERKQNDST